MEKQSREKIIASKNEFGFILDWSTMVLLFCVKRLIEKFKEKQINSAMVFIDLEKVDVSGFQNFFE